MQPERFRKVTRGLISLARRSSNEPRPSVQGSSLWSSQVTFPPGFISWFHLKPAVCSSLAPDRGRRHEASSGDSGTFCIDSCHCWRYRLLQGAVSGWRCSIAYAWSFCPIYGWLCCESGLTDFSSIMWQFVFNVWPFNENVSFKITSLQQFNPLQQDRPRYVH